MYSTVVHELERWELITRSRAAAWKTARMCDMNYLLKKEIEVCEEYHCLTFVTIGLDDPRLKFSDSFSFGAQY